MIVCSGCMYDLAHTRSQGISRVERLDAAGSGVGDVGLAGGLNKLTARERLKMCVAGG